MTDSEPDTPDAESDDETEHHCSECGSKVEPDERFCTGCGAAVNVSDEEAAADASEPLSTGREQPDDTIDKETVVGYLFWGAFGALVLVVAVTLFGFYTSTLRFINVWITDEYQPLVLALFNLILLLLGLTGLSLLVRRLNGSETEGTAEG